jgi:tetratricopeptide (TPR) repeat protein
MGPDQIPDALADADAAVEALERGAALRKAGDLDAALALFRAVAAWPDAALASAGWRHVSGIHCQRSAWDDAVAAARRAATLAQETGLRELYAEALNAEAIAYQLQGDWDRAVPLLEQMLELTADPKGQGIALQNLGSIAAQRGDFETARRYFLRSHQAFRMAGYTHGVAFVLNNFARAALDHGNPRVAQPLLTDALGAARRVGDRDLVALVTRNLAEAAIMVGELDRAGGLIDEAQAVFAAAGNRTREVECLRLRGELAERAGDREGAAERYAAAYTLAAEVGALQEAARISERLAGLRGVAADPDAPSSQVR